tara:strand:- start:3542 stop:4225 length:684 start_codon:yes stop_codon:yes gene_type:complete
MSKIDQLIELSSAPDNFRYVYKIDDLTSDELEKEGYYIGFPCVHNHVIRDKTNHWCYHCAVKIQSNICGFDINYLHSDYKTKYHRLWAHIKKTDPSECWEASLPGKRGPHRVCFPSYRSQYSCQKAENLTAHKAIYQCAWGDIGSMFVTRLCSNPWCLNPLHMTSRWNRRTYPKKIEPFVLDFDAPKLMRINKAKLLNREQEVIKEDYKNTIEHPLSVKDAPDYDEG